MTTNSTSGLWWNGTLFHQQHFHVDEHGEETGLYAQTMMNGDWTVGRAEGWLGADDAGEDLASGNAENNKRCKQICEALLKVFWEMDKEEASAR